VLVHGVPETPAVWDGVRSQLGRDDVVAVQLPGFACPRPDGFGATKEEYVDWLVGELEKLRSDGPVDLVGHDRGGGLGVLAVRDVPAPGLVLLPAEDPFLSAEGARSSAGGAGASVAELPGLGHWWMLQDPARGAKALEEFWASVT